MERQEFLDLAPLHAMGLLDGEERARFEKTLASADSAMKAAYAEAVRTASELSLAAPEASLSPDVLPKLMARIGAAPSKSAEGAPSKSRPAGAPGAASPTRSAAVPPAQPGKPPKPRVAFIFPLPFWVTSSVAAMVLCVGLLAYLSVMNRALNRRTAAFHETRARLTAVEDSLAQKMALLEVIRSKGMQVAVMNGLEPSPGGYGKIIWDPDNKRAILHISNLPPIPADKDYQLWVIRDQKPVDAGVFHVSAEKQGGELYRIDQLAEADRKRINAFAVTLEPKGGLPQPSGKMYLLGSI